VTEIESIAVQRQGHTRTRAIEATTWNSNAIRLCETLQLSFLCSLVTGLLLALTVFSTAVDGAEINDASDQVAPGTVITHSNWQDFKRFMPPAMQTLFAGDDYWRLPNDLEIDVGPAIPVPLPRRYLADTVTFGKQVKLEKSPQGRYVLEGYVAGMPFPSATSDLRLEPYELFYNTYYHYGPRLQRSINCVYAADSYGNFTLGSVDDVIYSQLMYLSDSGFPRVIPNSNDHFLVKYSEQLAPEQGKYTSSLDIMHADPALLDDIYVYLPSARRPLRMSEADLCAPVAGSDFTMEDSNLGPPSLPQDFEITYRGERKILALVHADARVFKRCSNAQTLPARFFYSAAKGVVPWAKPTLGKWELRTVYVIEMKRLPEFASGYCYGNRVIYVDKETFVPLATELYDSQGRLYKYILELLTPLSVPSTGVALGINGATDVFLVNFKDRHLTVATTEGVCYDTDCSPQYLDIDRYASPEGLTKIAQ
jgi:Protein of unknown function (DUF1329)